ncbi:MAG: lysophospholipid acyltransferase family protein [Pyrinomonadaceae bacterium]
MDLRMDVRAALKFTAFMTWTVGLYGIWFVAGFLIPNALYWRQVIFGAWTKGFVRISNMKIDIIGTPPKPPFFLVSNHLGYADMAALRAVVTGVFVAKSEIKDWFLAGRIVRDMGTIFIDRTNRRDIPRAGDEIIERLNAGEGVIVFPEGTSTKGEKVLPFNSSFFEFAARSNTPVSYVSISYRTPRSETPAHVAVCWWDDTGFLAHMWRLFKVREYTAVITFGDMPVVNADRKVLASQLHRRVAESFVPVL